MLNLIILFFVTSAIYSSVGFGGGSTYLALLLLWGIPYTIFPVIALSCNIIVVTGNCINYSRAGNLDLKFLAPYLVGSIPMAFIGGALIAVGFGLASPSLTALISRNASDEHQGAAMGASQSVQSLCRILGPITAGAAFSGFGRDAPPSELKAAATATDFLTWMASHARTATDTEITANLKLVLYIPQGNSY